MYENFIRYIITSGYIKKIIVFSKNEKQYYAKLFNVSDQMFEFVTLGYEDKTKIIKKQNSEMYFLSAGRSNRDYEFLMNAWKKEEKNILKDEVIDDVEEKIEEGTENVEDFKNEVINDNEKIYIYMYTQFLEI